VRHTCIIGSVFCGYWPMEGAGREERGAWLLGLGRNWRGRLMDGGGGGLRYLMEVIGSG